MAAPSHAPQAGWDAGYLHSIQIPLCCGMQTAKWYAYHTDENSCFTLVFTCWYIYCLACRSTGQRLRNIAIPKLSPCLKSCPQIASPHLSAVPPHQHTIPFPILEDISPGFSLTAGALSSSTLCVGGVNHITDLKKKEPNG